ncbi:MAG: hypothetical protein IH994_02495 [Proteobacteria bacterium]|nr:hypothetical protein [Pseudomonadota bacterium]
MTTQTLADTELADLYMKREERLRNALTALAKATDKLRAEEGLEDVFFVETVGFGNKIAPISALLSAFSHDDEPACNLSFDPVCNLGFEHESGDEILRNERLLKIFDEFHLFLPLDVWITDSKSTFMFGIDEAGEIVDLFHAAVSAAELKNLMGGE